VICIDCGKDIPDRMELVGALSIQQRGSLLICVECIAKYTRSVEVDIRFDDYRRSARPSVPGAGQDEPNTRREP
jgi:hypothetical protein